MASNRKNSFFIDSEYKILKAGKALIDYFIRRNDESPLGHKCHVYFFDNESPCADCPVEKSKESMAIEKAVLPLKGKDATRPVIVTPIPDEQNQVHLLVVDCLGELTEIEPADAEPQKVEQQPPADVLYFDEKLNIIAASGDQAFSKGATGHNIFEFLPGLSKKEHESKLQNFFKGKDMMMRLPVAVPDHPGMTYDFYKVMNAKSEVFVLTVANAGAALPVKNGQMHRIMALSRFASHVSHEVKNPLSILLTNLDMMRVDILEATSIEGVYKLQEYIDNMQQQVEYILKILDTVSALKVHKHDSIVQVDLKMLMNRIISMAHFKRPHPKNDIIVNFINDLPKIFMSEMAMERAISELIVALWQRGGNQSNIKVDVNYVKENDGYFEFDFYTSGRSFYIENLDRLLDEFFLFTPDPQDTHLGFLIAYAAILNHKGEMKFMPSSDNSAHVYVTLPRIPNINFQEEGD